MIRFLLLFKYQNVSKRKSSPKSSISRFKYATFESLRPYKTKYLLSLELKMQHDEQGETLFNIIALIIHSTRCRWEMARRVNDETLHTAQRSAVIISAVPVLHCSQVFFTGFQI